MATDILDLMDPGNADAYDADLAPAPEPTYLNKQAAFDMDGTVQRAFFHKSRKNAATTYMIFEFLFETGEYTHGADSPKAGAPAEEGDVISLMFDLTPGGKATKFILREMSSVVDACIGGRKGVASKANGEFGVTESTKAKLLKKVGADLNDFVSVTDAGEFRVTGLARILTAGLLDGSRINLFTRDKDPDSDSVWFKFDAKSLTPANDLEAIGKALG